MGDWQQLPGYRSEQVFDFPIAPGPLPIARFFSSLAFHARLMITCLSLTIVYYLEAIHGITV
jgi:hypothetical protein